MISHSLPHNIDSYLDKLSAHRAQLDPVNQFMAIRLGFDEVLSPGSVDLLFPEELKEIFCCDEFQRWTMKDLRVSLSIRQIRIGWISTPVCGIGSY